MKEHQKIVGRIDLPYTIKSLPELLTNILKSAIQNDESAFTFEIELPFTIKTNGITKPYRRILKTIIPDSYDIHERSETRGFDEKGRIIFKKYLIIHASKKI